MTTSKSSGTSAQLGYFLTEAFWENATALLEYQISLKATNKHFNTLSMFYYERLRKKDKQRLRNTEYFRERIANNLFYGLGNEFAIYSYPIPKSNLGLRKYSFFTYPMRLAYYSIGLYILLLSQEFVQQYYKGNDRIVSFYGGNLLINQKTLKLELTYNSVWYKPHYKDFRKKIRSLVDNKLGTEVVIHIDIQNYYEDISIASLLDFLGNFVKPSIQKEMRFDAVSRSQISAFFGFISNGLTGIPQMDNDVISSYLGYLYLIFADLLLDQELNKPEHELQQHSIVRYMDDLYIVLTFPIVSTKSQKELRISSIASRIADCLYRSLGLRLNSKTRLYWMHDKDDVKDLLKNLKKVSTGYEINDDDNKSDPKEKLDLILKQLEKLKRSSLDPTFNERSDLDDEILKEIYDKSVSQLVNAPQYKQRIEAIFDQFNFDLITAQPREILLVLLTDAQAKAHFEKFLSEKTILTSWDTYVILTYLSQTEFRSKRLLQLLKQHPYMSEIVATFEQQRIPSSSPGYFDLPDKQTLKLCSAPNVIEQMRLRVHAENRHDYSVALNHLLNEIHSLCFLLENPKKQEKDYDATDVLRFLLSQNLPHETCVKIRNLFDRRNKNPVSHADSIAWPVSEDEYRDYHHHVGLALSHIL